MKGKFTGTSFPFNYMDLGPIVTVGWVSDNGGTGLYLIALEPNVLTVGVGAIEIIN